MSGPCEIRKNHYNVRPLREPEDVDDRSSENGKLPKNECFTTSFSFKLFALRLKVLFNVILHEVTVSARTCREFREAACSDF